MAARSFSRRPPLEKLQTKKSEILNPATQALIAEVSEDGATSVRAKYARARAAQPAWAALPIKKRLDAIRAFRKRITEMHETLARTLTLEVGKPIRQSRNELNGLLGRIDFFLAEAPRILREQDPRRRQAKTRGANLARAAWRDREHLGVELSLLCRRQCFRSRVDRRQCGPVQALGICNADRPAHCRNALRGGGAHRCLRSRHRWSRRRSRAVAARRRRRFLYRLVCHRRQGRRGSGPQDGQGPARARRQGSRLCLRRRGCQPPRRAWPTGLSTTPDESCSLGGAHLRS